MSVPSCRGVRELLGVYVVGAIEPAERSVVDGHLSYCHDCREELAGLAGLPALLRRVPLADAERLAAGDQQAGNVDDPRPELLDSLLSRVTAQRRTRRLRSVFAIAAALLIAAGGTGAVTHALAPRPAGGPSALTDVAHARAGTVSAVVRYGDSTWGTQMWVRASGIRAGTTCKFWVLTTNGRRLVGGWTVGPGDYRIWYPADSPVPATRVKGFEITSGSAVVLRIPAPS